MLVFEGQMSILYAKKDFDIQYIIIDFHHLYLTHQMIYEESSVWFRKSFDHNFVILDKHRYNCDTNLHESH